jgi:hypothetical protein
VRLHGDLLDLIDAVLAPATVEAVAIARRDLFHSSFTPFAPNDCPVEYSVDIGERVNGVEPVACDRQRLVGAPEQLGGNLLAVDL